MKVDMFLLVILIVMFISQIVGAESVIVKYNTGIEKGYKDSVEELGLYLFEKGTYPKGYEYAEKDRKTFLQNASDPLTYQQTYLDQLNIRGLSCSEDLSVAVLDSGIDFSHPDLAGEGDIDVRGHGTAVAGIIGARSENGIGISGISDAHLVSIKIVNKTGEGRYFKLIKAIVHAVNEDIPLICISAGGHHDSYALKAAVDYANENGTLIIAAGGNTHSETVLYPAAFENVISVGSLNNEGQPCTKDDWGYKNGKALGSCYGSAVDFMLPGVNLYTTKRNGGYKLVNGTSYSAAILTGIAAHVIDKQPGLNIQELKVGLREILDFGVSASIVSVSEKPSFYASSVTEIQESEESAANGYASSDEDPELFDKLFITRSFDKNEISPGQTAVMKIEITNESLSDIRGFYFTDQVYKDLTVGTPEVTLDGSAIDITYEIEDVNSIYKKYVPHRFVVETPGFSENHPLEPGKKLIIEYPVTTSKTGSFYFENYNWVGLYKDSPEVSIFGYEQSGASLLVAMPDLAANAKPSDYIFDLEPVFEWANAGDGFTYELYVFEKAGSRLKKIFTKTDLATNSFDWSTAGITLESGVEYQWKVRAIKGDIKGKYLKLKFKPYKFETPFIVSPIGVMDGTSFEPTFSWAAVDGVSGDVEYKVFLYKADGKKPTLISETEHATNSASWSALKGSETAFIPGMEYQWAVGVFYNGSPVSALSEAGFSYFNDNVPELVDPIDFVPKLTQSFKWNAPSGGHDYVYDLHISEIKGKKVKSFYSKEDIAATSAEVTLAVNKDYVWSVTAKYTSGSVEVISSSPRALVTTKIPKKPVIIAPIGSTENLKPTIHWTFWDSGEVQDTQMRFYIEVKEGPKKIVQDFAAYNETSYTIGGGSSEVTLSEGKKYKITVIAETLDESISSASKPVNVVAAKVQTPEIVYPENKATVNADTSSGIKWKIAWKQIDGISKYKVQIKQGKTTIKELAEVTCDTYTDENYTYCRYYYDNATPLEDGKKYSVNVSAVNDGGDESNLSNTVKFKTYAIGDIAIDSPNSKKFHISHEFSDHVVFQGSEAAYLGTYGTGLVQQFRLYKKDGRKYTELTSDWTVFEDDYTHKWGDDESEEALEHNGKYKIEFRCKKNISGTDYYSDQKTVSFKALGADQVYSLTTPGDLAVKGQKKTYEVISELTPVFQFKTKDHVNYSYFEINISGSGTYKYYGENAADADGYTLFEFQLPVTKKLKPNKKYKWKVRTVLIEDGNKMTSDWSETRMFIPVGIATPVLSAPVDEEIDTTRPLFEFEADERTTRYSMDIFVYDPIKNKNIKLKTLKIDQLPMDELGNVEFQSPIDLMPGAKYFWRVKSESMNTKGQYSELSSFTIKQNSAGTNEL